MISFVVPAHNEARLIGATLIALQAVAGSLEEPCEIVVVDDDSSDDTGLIAHCHGALVVPVQRRHIAAARNAGARAASGEILFFVDADTLVDRPVVAAALQALRRGAVGGGAAVHLQAPLALHERWLQTLSVAFFRLTRIAPGCFVFCHRSAFEAAGGFDERYFAGEDIALSRALARQGKFVLLRQAVVTSARKLRVYGVGDHLRLLGRLLWRGRGVLRTRQGLEFWYGQRRDPGERP